MNIRRNVLIISCILSIGMPLSSCNKGENHIKSEIEELNKSDVNDVVMNEEDKLVEFNDVYWIDQELVNAPGFEKTFTALPSNGENLNITVKSNSNAKTRLIIYRNGRENKNVVIDGNKDCILKYIVSTNTTFRVVLETEGGDGPFSVSIKARQF